MEVNMIILPKNNSDINLGMKKQIKQLFENLFNNVNDSSFEINFLWLIIIRSPLSLYFHALYFVGDIKSEQNTSNQSRCCEK